MTTIPRLLKRIVVATLIVAGIGGCASTETRSDDEGVAITVAPLQQAKAAYNSGNYAVAAEILTRQAQQGDDEALYALGYLYYYGHGVPKDQNRALALFSQAAQQGNKKAVKSLTLLSRTLGEQDLARSARQDEGLAGRLGEPKLAEIDTPSAQNIGGQVAISPEGEGDRPIIPSSRSRSQENTIGAEGRSPLLPEEIPLPETAKADNQPFTPEWLERQDRNHYTLQLAAGGSVDSGARFIRTHKLQNKAMVVTTERDDKPLYIIVYGVFPTLSTARQALRELPPALSKNQPWIRRLGELF